jgi:N-acetylglucosaminyl-diphospho-decaprenol L-rhamnosyltransferase
VGPTLSAVIVSFNCRDHLLRCLESLEQQRADLDLEAIVVDNGSEDSTVDAARERFPWVDVVASPENRGFAWASNRGLERATCCS